jgi:arabinofuranan 3-O-arabinosyltransferase
VVLAKDEPQPSGCMLTSMRWVCSPSLAVSTEEQFGFDRTFSESSAEPAAVHGSAILVNTALAGQFTRLSPRDAQVTASSVYTAADPQDQATAAFDGDPATSWVAAAADRHPTLTIRWTGPRTVSRLSIERPPGASGLLQVKLTGSGGQRRVAWASDAGALTFAPMRTSSLTLTFIPNYSPVQITGIDIPGVPPLNTPGGTFRLPCGLGPALRMNGRVVPTSVTGSFASLRTARPVQFTACSPVRLAAGLRRVRDPGRRSPGRSRPRHGGPGRGGPGHGPRGRLVRGAPGRGRHRAVDGNRADGPRQRRRALLPGGRRELQSRLEGGYQRPDAAAGAARRMEAGLGAAGRDQRPGPADVRA